jgi:hypothetical protein
MQALQCIRLEKQMAAKAELLPGIKRLQQQLGG